MLRRDERALTHVHVLIGNVKQVLSIVLAVIIFDLSITATNGLGILLTLAGGAWYR